MIRVNQVTNTKPYTNIPRLGQMVRQSEDPIAGTNRLFSSTMSSFMNSFLRMIHNSMMNLCSLSVLPIYGLFDALSFMQIKLRQRDK